MKNTFLLFALLSVVGLFSLGSPEAKAQSLVGRLNTDYIAGLGQVTITAQNGQLAIEHDANQCNFDSNGKVTSCTKMMPGYEEVTAIKVQSPKGELYRFDEMPQFRLLFVGKLNLNAFESDAFLIHLDANGKQLGAYPLKASVKLVLTP